MSRFQRALIAAAALHCALYVGFGRERRETAARLTDSDALEVEVDWVAETPVPVPSEAQAVRREEDFAAPPPTTPRRTVESAPVLSAPVEADASDSVASLEGSPASDAAPQVSALAVPGRRRVPIDLGLDGRIIALDAAHAARTPDRVDPSRQLNRSLENGLAASDTQRGLARGGALLGSLRSVAREVGPQTGSAVIQVQVDASGAPIGISLLQGSGPEWDRVLRRLREQLASQRVRVPAGAAGLRITLSVNAKMQRPSGKAAGGPSVDVDWNPLQVAGDFDVADLSGSLQRIVATRVLSEEVL